jgi:predicted phosphodiesterase
VDALTAAADAGVDILLAGHFHRSYSASAREMVETAGAALVVQAGTATSTRLRGGEQQSFNWIELAKDSLDLQVLRWNENQFEPGRRTFFAFDGENWHFVGRDEESGVAVAPAQEIPSEGRN